MTSTSLSLTILLKSFISGLIIREGKESPVSCSTTLTVLISSKGVELKTVDDSWRQWMTSSNLQVLWLPPQGNQCQNLQSPSQPSPWVSACLCIKPTHIWLSTKLKACTTTERLFSPVCYGCKTKAPYRRHFKQLKQFHMGSLRLSLNLQLLTGQDYQAESPGIWILGLLTVNQHWRSYDSQTQVWTDWTCHQGGQFQDPETAALQRVLPSLEKSR